MFAAQAAERKVTNMAIAEQFAGLDMGMLIGGPLTAAADASVLLANATADFIERVGFENSGKARTVAFSYEKRTPNDDGTSSLDELKVNVPLLAIVPIPNLQIDEVNVLFDMEVKQSECSKSSTDMSASMNASANAWFVKVNISGSVSSHKENTRTSDNSAKYHVDVRATNHGIPEGLARVLDMMAANVAPALVGSSIKNADGSELPEASRKRAEKLKKIRSEISAIETRRNAASNNLQDSLGVLRNVADSQMSVYSLEMSRLTDEQREGGADANFSTVTESWNSMKSQLESMVKMIAESEPEGGTSGGVSSIFSLKAFRGTEAVADYASGEEKYEAMSKAQASAVSAQKKLAEVDQSLTDKKAEYNNLLSGAQE